MGVEMQGFDEFIQHLDGVSKRFEHHSDISVKRSTNVIRMNVIKEIDSQPASWAALSPEYAKRKAAMGGSRLMLVSGVRSPSSKTPMANYRNSYDVIKVDHAAYAAGTNYPQARALEHGFEARGVKARPHVEPAVNKSKPEILKEYKNMMQAVLGKS